MVRDARVDHLEAQRHVQALFGPDAKGGEVTPYVLEFTLPGLPKTPNGSHGHWRVKYAQSKRWKQAVFTAAWPFKPPQPLDSAILTLIRHSSVQSDFDNLVSSFKACVDGLRQAGIITDDKKINIGQPVYLWQQAPPKKGFITIKVEGFSKESLDRK